jgi:8-oxo-dGTP diphosphatase
MRPAKRPVDPVEIPHQQTLVHVAVGVIRNSSGEVLLARRHPHQHQGGLWEFPGGKLEAGETVADALRRELQEELTITVRQASPLIRIAHDYGDKRVLLDVWRVDAFDGEPQCNEDQPIRWVAPEALPEFDFPAANRPIVTAARLPGSYPIINGQLDDEDALFEQLEIVCRHGHQLAQWRVKADDDQAYLVQARRAVEHGRPHGLSLLLNAKPEQALAAGAAGVHLNGRRLWALRHRPLPAPMWVAASCHNPADILQAERMGVDFIVLSPVLATPSHPDSPPLGWDRFGAWTDAAKLPVFALGGLGLDHLAQAQTHGAQGIAGIRAFL